MPNLASAESRQKLIDLWAMQGNRLNGLVMTPHVRELFRVYFREVSICFSVNFRERLLQRRSQQRSSITVKLIYGDGTSVTFKEGHIETLVLTLGYPESAVIRCITISYEDDGKIVRRVEDFPVLCFEILFRSIFNGKYILQIRCRDGKDIKDDPDPKNCVIIYLSAEWDPLKRGLPALGNTGEISLSTSASR